MSQTHPKIRQALKVLAALDAPNEQQNERSALTLLALADLQPKMTWKKATTPLRKITEMMDWMQEHYAVKYAPNTRETIRRQTVHQFVQMGILLENPDQPDRPINSPNWCYQLTPALLKLIQTFGDKNWESSLASYLKSTDGKNRLKTRHRDLPMTPIKLPKGQTINLSAGGQNNLIRQIIEDYCPRFVSGGSVLLVGDAGNKNIIEDNDALSALGIQLPARGKAPDVIIHDIKHNWLIVIEAVTSHGPIDQKRRNEISDLFSKSDIGIVYLTAFPNTATYVKFAKNIAWETEVWIADAPDHLIHYNGSRYQGPYET